MVVIENFKKGIYKVYMKHMARKSLRSGTKCNGKTRSGMEWNEMECRVLECNVVERRSLWSAFNGRTAAEKSL